MTADHGATLDLMQVPFTRDGVEQAADTWLASSPRAGAICAFNDEFAIALLSALAVRAVRVPDDVAVIGVDDIPLGALVTPSLTTVTADYRGFGEAIAEATTAVIADRPAVDLALPAVRVVHRQSA
jgi:DNA-binding LacI/PurR family transcriptional regulator